MAIREELILDLSQALSQLDDLERSLDALIQPIVIPVKVDDDAGLERLARDADRAEDEFEDLRQEVDRTDTGLEKVERQAKKTGDDLERAGKKGEKSFKGMTKGILAFGAALGGIAALRAVGGFFADSIQAASDLEESVSKAGVVFGEFFGDIEKFTETAPQALGLSTAAALEMTGTFGNLFVALGLSRQAAAELAPDIVQLGADLASFNNLEVTDALDKLRAGLVGEAEPLRALGVNLTAATTNAKALELGLVDVNGVVTEAGKVQARYALILEQTQTSQGDFARTSDGLANTLRTLSGEFDNFKAGVGEALTPAFEAIISALPPALELMEDLIPLIADMASGFADAVDDGEGLVEVLTNIATATGATSDVLGGFGGFVVGVLKGIGQAAFGARVDKTFDSWTEAIEDFDETFTALSIRKIKGTLFEKLAEIDADPMRALVDAIESLQFLDLDIEDFAATVERFFKIAGVDGPEALRIFQALSTRGGDFKFTAEQVAILDAVMRDLFGITGALSPSVDEVAQAITALGDAGLLAGPEIKLFAAELEVIARTLERGEINAAIAELEADFDTLPGVIGAAADAIETEGGEVIESLTGFIADFRDALEALEMFELNLALLRALGLGDVADIFEGLGPEDAAQAAADAVLNPAEAQELADLLAGRVATIGPAMTGSIAQEISSEPVTSALIQTIIAAAGDANTPAVRQALLDLANALAVTIPLTFGPLPDLTVGQAIAAAGGFPIGENVGAGAPGGDTFNINQVFTGEPHPNIETERAAQAISTIIRN